MPLSRVEDQYSRLALHAAIKKRSQQPSDRPSRSLSLSRLQTLSTIQLQLVKSYSFHSFFSLFPAAAVKQKSRLCIFGQKLYTLDRQRSSSKIVSCCKASLMMMVKTSWRSAALVYIHEKWWREAETLSERLYHEIGTYKSIPIYVPHGTWNLHG